jgi:hypothetical protein
MANAYVEALEAARLFLIERRRRLVEGIPRLQDSDLDRVVRYAQNVTVLQAAIDSIDTAIGSEGQADRRRSDRRREDRRTRAESRPEGERRTDERRRGDRRGKPSARR